MSGNEEDIVEAVAGEVVYQALGNCLYVVDKKLFDFFVCMAYVGGLGKGS